MKKLIILCLISIVANNLFSSEASDKLLDIQNKQQKNITAKHALRVKLLKEDKEIIRLHKRIMALHKELAIKINAKKSMRILIAQQKNLKEQVRIQKEVIKAEKKKELIKE
jgi:hypothetical protein